MCPPRKPRENQEGKRYGCLSIGPLAFRLDGKYYYHTICDCGLKDVKCLTSKIKKGRPYCNWNCKFHPRNKIEGETLTKREIKDLIGLTGAAFKNRVKKGIPLLRAKQVRDGSVQALADEAGVCRFTMSRRIKKYGRDSHMLRWSSKQMRDYQKAQAKLRGPHETQSG